VTQKVTKVWAEDWNEKSEKWAREMPDRFVEGAGKTSSQITKEEKEEDEK
jgi:hypothetical protein